MVIRTRDRCDRKEAGHHRQLRLDARRARLHTGDRSDAVDTRGNAPRILSVTGRALSRPSPPRLRSGDGRNDRNRSRTLFAHATRTSNGLVASLRWREDRWFQSHRSRRAERMEDRVMFEDVLVGEPAGGFLMRWFGEPQPYLRARWIFLRALGAIFFSAFYSLYFQIHGLNGPKGILPAASYLPAARDALGWRAYWYIPSLFWFSASDLAMSIVVWTGLIAS